MKKQNKGGENNIKFIKKNKKLILIISAVLIILALFCLKIAFAKFKTEEIFNKNLDIATPIFIVEGNDSTKISAINNIGYYEFKVKNFNENQISETGFEYTVEVIADTDESIKFELYRDNEPIKLENLKSEQLILPGNEKTEQNYKLKVIYDKNLGTKGIDILKEIQVKIHSEQGKIG